MILHQHKAAQVGAEVPPGSVRQRRDDGVAVRRYPPLAEETDRMDRQHKLLDLIGFIAFEARSRRHCGLDDPIFDADAGADFSAAGTLLLLAGLGWFGGLVHAAGFDIRAAFQALQPGDLFTQFDHGLLEGGHFSQQFDNQFLQLVGRQSVEGGRWLHT